MSPSAWRRRRELWKEKKEWDGFQEIALLFLVVICAHTYKRGAGFGSVNNTQPAAAAGCGNGPISSAVIHQPIRKKKKLPFAHPCTGGFKDIYFLLQINGGEDVVPFLFFLDFL